MILLKENQGCIRRHARNVSVKVPTTQRMDAWEGIQGLRCCQLSAVVLRLTVHRPYIKVREQNGGLQEMPLKAGIARHVHGVGQRRVRLYK